MKKILCIFLSVLMCFSIFVMPVNSFNNEGADMVTIDVPTFTFFTTLSRVFQNFFESFKDQGVRKPVLVTNIEITDGPTVVLKPSNNHCSYKIYYFDEYVSGKQDVTFKTHKGISDSGYVVVVSDDGFVSKATKVKYDIPEEYNILTFDMGDSPYPDWQDYVTRHYLFPPEEPEWEGHVFLGYSSNKYAIEGEFKPGHSYFFAFDATLYAIYRSNDIVGRGYCGEENDQDVIWNVKYDIDKDYYTFFFEPTVNNPRVKNYNSREEVPWRIYLGDLDKIDIRGVQNIPAYGFYNALMLTDINIGKDITEIGSHAFHFCRELQSITIPSNIQKIGEFAFSGCYGLTKIKVFNSNTEIETHAFDAENATLYCPQALANAEGYPWEARNVEFTD